MPRFALLSARRRAGLLLLSALVASAPAAAPGADGLFPEPAALRGPVAFWARVYVEVDSKGGLLHDADHPQAVWEVLDLSAQPSPSARQRVVDARRDHWRHVLEELARGGARDLGAGAREAAATLEAALGRRPGAADFRRAAGAIRFQRGQRDRFRAGLVRAGRHEAEMRRIFAETGLPEDLAYLPHVESSFDTRAYSKYGAAGVWQFMRSTGRRYLTVDYVVDERLDPIRATRAAAALLRDNFERLGTWPLAITAYNHGAAGMSRAVRETGSRDIGVIVQRYRGRTFGFASRNFYAQFLAARRIATRHAQHFGSLRRAAPAAVDIVELPFFADVADIERHLGVARAELARLNPALRPPVLRDDKRIPKGFHLRLPRGRLPDGGLAAALPAAAQHDGQRRSRMHRVQRGETLSTIARLHGARVEDIVALNGLPSRHRIYAGQVLELIGREPPPARAVTVAARAQSAEPAALARPLAPRPAPAPAPAPAPDSLPARTGESPWRRIEGDRVVVDIGETLGHFAEWLEVPTQQLRRLNGLALRKPIRMGQRLRLDFSRVTPDAFLERRIEYHKGVEEDFFGSYAVTGLQAHTLRRGESLWSLAHDVYELPLWLIHRYNPGTDLTRLAPGSRLSIPVVEARDAS